MPSRHCGSRFWGPSFHREASPYTGNRTHLSREDHTQGRENFERSYFADIQSHTRPRAGNDLGAVCPTAKNGECGPGFWLSCPFSGCSGGLLPAPPLVGEGRGREKTLAGGLQGLIQGPRGVLSSREHEVATSSEGLVMTGTLPGRSPRHPNRPPTSRIDILKPLQARQPPTKRTGEPGFSRRNSASPEFQVVQFREHGAHGCAFVHASRKARSAGRPSRARSRRHRNGV